MRDFLLAFVILLMGKIYAIEEVSMQGMAWISLSPDGQKIAFECLNDLWIAPAKGGEAIRLIKSNEREAYTKFSPDGKRIYYGSDQSGSMQLHSIQINGTDPRVHTAHTEGNILEAISDDGTFALVRGMRDSSGYEATRPIKIDLTENARELELFDATAHSLAISHSGNKFLFCRGGEQLYRKGYRGSRASSIHLYDAEHNSFKEIISEPFESRSPLWCKNPDFFYYVSSKSGDFEIWKAPISEGSHEQLTQMGKDGVIMPALSKNGEVMIFRSGQSVYYFRPEDDKKPVPVHFFTEDLQPKNLTRKERVRGTSQVSFDPKGEQIIFSAAGDLWAIHQNNHSPTRLTSTDHLDEREPCISNNAQLVFFIKDDGMNVEVCSASWNGTEIGIETRLYSSTRSKRNLRLSPNGQILSWIESTGDLVTFFFATGKSVTVSKAWDTSAYDWSPCSKWLILVAKDKHSNRDLYLVNAKGLSTPVNLTFHPAFEGSPKFSPDGKHIVFTARRQTDQISRLWLIDTEPLSKDNLSPEDITIMTASVRPLKPEIGEPIRVAWAPHSDSVLYQSRDAQDLTVYQIPIDGSEVKEYADFRGIFSGHGKDGRSFWRKNRVPSIYHNGKLTEYSFSFTVEQSRPDRLRLGFRKIARILSEQFYDSSLNGKDWQAIIKKYESSAIKAWDSRQFDRIVAQLLGELNASHLTFKTKPWGISSQKPPLERETAFPGINFKNSWEGALMVDKVLEGSPISLVTTPPVKGEVILRIGGKEVDAKTPLNEIFNGAKGSALPILISSTSGETRTLELIPISYPRARYLDRLAKLKRAQTMISKTGKKITYLPFRKMKATELKNLSIEVYRASVQAEGLILDLRDNIGGRVADELLALFCQPVHSFTLPRNGVIGYPSDRRVSPSWEGPMIVICNENTYSNAEIFCHAFKKLKRGKLVGTPTNGGVISAIPIQVPEMGQLQVPFRGWFHIDTGNDLELNGAVPDIQTKSFPGAEMNDTDLQLETAITEIQNLIQNIPNPKDPRFKSEK